MNSRMAAHVYISFAGVDRLNNQQFTNEELNKWIEENVKLEQHNLANWGNKRLPYLAGIYLTPAQASFFKLKFDI